MKRRPSILLVDDDDTLRSRLGKAFERRGFDVHLAGSVDEAVGLAATNEFALAVVDLRMPSGSGLDLVTELKAQKPHMQIVVLTGYGSIATATEAMRRGATSYLPKPADADDILRAFGFGAEMSPTDLQGPSLTVHETETPTLERAKWEHINRVLHDVDGNVSEAARRLGLHRRSLQRILQKYPPRR